MSTLFSCSSIAPEWLCRQHDIVLYLAPSLLLAGLIRYLSARHPFFFLFTLAGTVCHELAHFGVGLVTAARPVSLTVIPCRVGGGWELGSVQLTRVRWYNAAPAALAPFLVLLVPLAVAAWRTVPGWTFQPLDAALALLLAPQFLAFWPSPVDWKIALRSWPCLLIAALAWCLLARFEPRWSQQLVQFVTSHAGTLTRA